MKSKNFFISLIKYGVVFLCFASLNSVYPNVFGSVSLYIGLLYIHVSPLVLSVLLCVSFLTFKSLEMLLCGAVLSTLLGGLFMLYKIKGKTPKIEIIFFYFTAVLPYIIWCGDMVLNAVYSAIICLFAFISITALTGLNKIIQKAKATGVQLISLSLIFILIGIGLINLLGINFYKGLAVLLLLFSTKCFSKFVPYQTSGILAVPLAIATQNASYFCTLFLWFIFSIIFVENSRIFSALGVILGECICLILLRLYPDYTIVDGVSVAIPALFFAFLPNSLFAQLDEYFNLHPNRILSYDYINRTRTSLSSKLYEIGGVFLQMENALTVLGENAPTTDNIITDISQEVINNVCTTCVLNERCKIKCFPSLTVMHKFVSVGITKNRVTLIDLPREFTDICGYPNSVIFEVNRLIGEYSTKYKISEERRQKKQLMQGQVSSLGKIMKSLAFDMSKTLKVSDKQEAQVLDFMKSQGLPIYGLLILGESELTEVNVFLSADVLSKKRFLPALCTALSAKLSPIKTQKYNDSLVSVTYKKSPCLDAIFGVSSVTKSGSPCSGDLHSLIKIDEGKFLVALSDGMGSGENAHKTSLSSITLIESYYRAGLDSNSILHSVNDILSINSKDSFSAVDIAVVNLFDGAGDFIKIGAPFGFVLSRDGVRFIEGSSLPLGILDDIKPSSLSLKLAPDDVIVLLSDGVTDAFGSSSEMVEFLRTAPLNNPQDLSDSIIQKALYMSKNTPNDDMTALCIRIIQKSA